MWVLFFLSEEFCLPRRIFCPLKSSGSLYVCDYQFSDEGLSEIVDRLKEMLGVDTAEEDLDTTQEMTAEITQGSAPTGERIFIYLFFFSFMLKML